MPNEPSETDKSAAGGGPSNFIRERVEADLAAGKNDGRLVTRFPPEPNGYLHIGHAKAICVDFGLAEELGGRCNLRFDDTNPVTEDTEYVEAIERDVGWLGFQWDGDPRYASDYFEQLFAWAEQLVEDGKAYVDSQSPEEIRKGRGSFYEEGVDSPYRDRPAAESLALLRKMRAGELAEGEAVLRARIDMQSKNLNMRDPLIYRIVKKPHHRTGNEWPIYPMYDYAHGLSDAIEGVTHSICTLEFEDHRPLYDWFIEQLPVPARPEQIEFARLNLTYTLMSKRKLLALVEGGHVSGWDDPRMPTLAGMRRLGYTPEAVRRFCDRIGVAKRDGVVDVGLLEHALREHLNAVTPRRMAVLDPLKLVITNYPEGETETFEAQNNPEDPDAGTRQVPFSRTLWVERGDFRADAPKKWHRLAPGREVRLRAACLVTCQEVIEDERGEVVELRCTWDPESRGGKSPDGRKVRGTLHWVSAAHALDAEVRLYDRLFNVETPSGPEDLNPDSLVVERGCKLEPSLGELATGDRVQFERLGYFCLDPDSRPGAPVFNRTITLRDSWAKLEKKLGGA
jgi:glutaminyl-tRNA synthetase